MKIKKTDPNYAEVVDDRGCSYTIDTDKVQDHDEIECPNDPDMLIKKNPDETISVIKKSYSKTIFIKN